MLGRTFWNLNSLSLLDEGGGDKLYQFLRSFSLFLKFMIEAERFINLSGPDLISKIF